MSIGGRLISPEIDRDFTLLRRLGSGGMGEVFLAEERHLHRRVAIKVLRLGLEGAEAQEMRVRLEIEARTLAQLEHPNIVRLYRTIIPANGPPALVMEFVDGPTLGELLRVEPRLTLERMRQVFIPIAKALRAAHGRPKPIIHRDLKPGNIMISRVDGEARLLDFSIARSGEKGTTRLTVGGIIGTPPYMAPEQIREQPLTSATDVYALGVVMYLALNGHLPFRAKNDYDLMTLIVEEPPPPLLPDVPERVARMVLQCLEKDPARRPTSPGDLARLLEQAFPHYTTGEPPLLPESLRAMEAAPAATSPPLPPPPQQPAPPPPPAPAAPQRPPSGTAAPRPFMPSGESPRRSTPSVPLQRPPLVLPPGADETADPAKPPPPPPASAPLPASDETADPASPPSVRPKVPRAPEQSTVPPVTPSRKVPASSNPDVTAQATLQPTVFGDVPPPPAASAPLPPARATDSSEGATLLDGTQPLLPIPPGVRSTPTPKSKPPAAVPPKPSQATPTPGSKPPLNLPPVSGSSHPRWEIAGPDARKSKTGSSSGAYIRQPAAVPAEPEKPSRAEPPEDPRTSRPVMRTATGGNTSSRVDVRRPAVDPLGDNAPVQPGAVAPAPQANRQAAQIVLLVTAAAVLTMITAGIVFVALQRGKPAPVEDPVGSNVVVAQPGIGGSTEPGQPEATPVPTAPPPTPLPTVQATAEVPAVEWETPPEPPKETTQELDLGGGVTLPLRRIEGGTFLMGSPTNEESRQPNEAPFTVTLSPYWIGETEVTAGQFARFIAESGHRTDAERYGGAQVRTDAGWRKEARASWRNPGFQQTRDFPVVCVSWNDARAFCEWLAAKTGRGVTLPTEAQWEFACRGGKRSVWYWGEDASDARTHANSADQTAADSFPGLVASKWIDGHAGAAPVRSFTPNAFGLHDIAGNVWEWCFDSSGPYPAEDQTDWFRHATDSTRVLRGGSWGTTATWMRSAARFDAAPEHRSQDVGFRIVVVEDPNVWSARDTVREAPIITPSPVEETPVSDAEAIKSLSSSGAYATVTPAGDGTSALATQVVLVDGRRRLIVELGGGVTQEFLWVEPGSFRMGSEPTEAGRDTSEAPFDVRIPRGFWLAETEVTQAQWERIVGASGASFNGPTLPVERTSWEDAVTYCRRLGVRIGRNVTLPTEAQWEYACRAGTATPFAFGETITAAEANIDGSIPYASARATTGRSKTTPVKYYAPNAWGFFDMHGNVQEWCLDAYGPYPTDGARTDWSRQDPAAATRVVRGGSWGSVPRFARSAARDQLSITERSRFTGFRPAIVDPAE